LSRPHFVRIVIKPVPLKQILEMALEMEPMLFIGYSLAMAAMSAFFGALLYRQWLHLPENEKKD
jgi:hypothetical protein